MLPLLLKQAPGPGEGFEDHGARTAPPLPPAPWVRLPVGEVMPPGAPLSSANDRIPMRLAMGWEGHPGP